MNRFSLKILGLLTTSSITIGGVYLAIQKHKTLTIKDLLQKEGKVILGEEHEDEWKEKLNMGEINDILSEINVENLKNKCKELLKILLIKEESFIGEKHARKLCIRR